MSVLSPPEAIRLSSFEDLVVLCGMAGRVRGGWGRWVRV